MHRKTPYPQQDFQIIFGFKINALDKEEIAKLIITLNKVFISQTDNKIKIIKELQKYNLPGLNIFITQLYMQIPNQNHNVVRYAIETWRWYKKNEDLFTNEYKLNLTKTTSFFGEILQNLNKHNKNIQKIYLSRTKFYKYTDDAINILKTIANVKIRKQSNYITQLTTLKAIFFIMIYYNSKGTNIDKYKKELLSYCNNDLTIAKFVCICANSFTIKEKRAVIAKGKLKNIFKIQNDGKIKFLANSILKYTELQNILTPALEYCDFEKPIINFKAAELFEKIDNYQPIHLKIKNTLLNIIRKKNVL